MCQSYDLLGTLYRDGTELLEFPLGSPIGERNELRKREREREREK
jgi:hypothetical protein